MSDKSFTVWQVDEPEFKEDTEYKFDIIAHPFHMALGTDGKNDDLVWKSINVRADWVIQKLLRACITVGIICFRIMLLRWLNLLVVIGKNDKHA